MAFARACIELGDTEALHLAEETLTLAERLMDEFGINVYRPDLHECRGRIAIPRGSIDAGRADIRRAVELLQVMDARGRRR